MISALLTLVLAAADPRAAVARVDATTLTGADVADRMALIARTGRTLPPAQLLNLLIDEAVLADGARREGLDREPAVREQIAFERRTILAKALADDAAAKAQLSEDALRALYHASGDSAQLVLVKVESREDAAAALARVQRGGELAAEAARSLDSGLAARGGKTGPMTRGELDANLADAVFRAPVGALVGPVELRVGWAIAKVLEKTVAPEAGFAARRASIAAFARAQLAAESRKHLAQQLRARSGVTVDEKFLATAGTRGTLTPEELEHVIATVKGAPIRFRDILPGLAQAAAASGHLAGPTVKLAFANAAVDEALLAAAATEGGLEASPEVAAALARTERAILARVAANRAATAAGSGAPEEKLRARIAQLRARAKIQIDEAALAAVTGPAAPPAR